MSIEKHEYVNFRKENVVYYSYTEDDWSRAFAYTPGRVYINEVGDGGMRWSPVYPLGWRETERGHASITSYEQFGSDYYQAQEVANHWREQAGKAWAAFVAQGIIKE